MYSQREEVHENKLVFNVPCCPIYSKLKGTVDVVLAINQDMKFLNQYPYYQNASV